MKIEYNKQNFDKLVKLHEAALEVASIAYKASKSDISNVKENLKELNDRLYEFRNEQFRIWSGN